MTAVASLVATLDRRIVDLFDTLEELLGSDHERGPSGPRSAFLGT
jgi:hypothetical protein